MVISKAFRYCSLLLIVGLLSGCGDDLELVKKLLMVRQQHLQVIEPRLQPPAQLRKRAEQGSALAQRQLAQWYIVHDKEVGANYWWAHCAALADRACTKELAHSYVAGAGAPRDPATALTLLRTIQQPDDIEVANSIAWLLATVPNKTLRDPQQAWQLMDAVQQHHDLNANMTDTMAAIHAALGHFSQAAQLQQQALTKLLAENANSSKLDTFRYRLKLYRQQQPYIGW